MKKMSTYQNWQVDLQTRKRSSKSETSLMRSVIALVNASCGL